MTPPVESLAPTLAATLAPQVERGGSALVVGGTRAWRAAVARAVADALAALPVAPVVARLAPRATAGTGLADEVVAAVEDALGALGAPGALYDEPGEAPVGPLGGWLFRARAVGRAGVALVLEEVDGWLAGAGTDDALAALAALADETGRRALSVLVTARAGEASGAPALPEDVVRRFGAVHAGGGPATVTRDPWMLVGALAGRSFALPDLRAALASWLELPAAAPGATADDTLVVFSSPLAPPVFPALPEVEWPRTEPAEGPEPAPPPPPAPAAPDRDAAADARRWSAALRTAVQVRERLRALRTGPRPETWEAWERAFREDVAPLPRMLGELAVGEAAVGVEPTRLRREATGAVADFERDFGRAYAAAFARWVAGDARPAMLSDLPARLGGLAAERGARGTAFVVLTGLRWDLWARFKARVLPLVGGLALAEEGALWAARPTTPAGQRALVARGLAALADGAAPEPVALARSLDEALRPRREHFGATEVLRLDAYAAALGAPGATLDGAAEAVEAALPGALRALCGGFVGRTAVVLAADVGVGAVAGGWTFGGDSPFEVVVPYALLTWG